MKRITYWISLSVFFALVWMGITARAELGAFVIGFVVSFVVLGLIGVEGEATPAKIPRQVWLLLGYILLSFWEITLASFDVAKRILSREMPLKPGIVAIPTFDPTQDSLIAALSAHAITITPGQLIVDFDGAETMYIHCLDIDSTDKAIAQQQTRLATLNGILGRD